MPEIIRLRLSVRDPPDISISVRKVAPHIELKSTVPGNAPWYEGAYSISPDDQRHILETKGKRMREDVNVLPIPIYEVSNSSDGYTIYIGSDLIG